jgi:hypothetical protein
VYMLLHAIVNHHGNNHSVASLVASWCVVGGGERAWLAPFSTRKGQKWRKKKWQNNQCFDWILFHTFCFIFHSLVSQPSPLAPPPPFFPLEMTYPFFPSNYY